MSFWVFLVVFCAKIDVIFVGIYLFDSFNGTIYALPPSEVDASHCPITCPKCHIQQGTVCEMG